MASTVLLVDSDISNRIFWTGLLHARGYQVTTASDGRSAINFCAYSHPDLVLLHAALPDLCSIEVSRQIKSNPRNRLTPVVILPATPVQQDAIRNFADAADDILDQSLCPSEKLLRIQFLLDAKSYVDRHAESLLLSLARSIELRDRYTEGHGERLSHYASCLAEHLGMQEEQIQALRIAGIVHDVGKVVVPDTILHKPGPLTQEEKKIIQQHPVAGEQICAPLKSFALVLPIVRHHHERMDGSGYPDSLRSDQIPLAARILQTVDIYDALTTDRPYRKALRSDQALAVMHEETARGWLDGSLVSMVQSLFGDSLWGPASFLPRPS